MLVGELFWIICIFLASLVSPGPDFAVVVKNALTRSRFSAQKTALGIVAALFIHISYILLGMSILLKFPMFLLGVQFLGALFLIYLGVKSLWSKKGKEKKTLENLGELEKIQKRGFWEGFLTNLLNPKCAFFLITLFSQLQSGGASNHGIYIFACIVPLGALIWFSSLAWVLSHPKIQSKMQKWEAYISKAMGIVLMGYGIKIILDVVLAK